jgi:hypothetical protein
MAMVDSFIFSVPEIRRLLTFQIDRLPRETSFADALTLSEWMSNVSTVISCEISLIHFSTTLTLMN